MNLYDPALARATLASYDAEEAEMTRALASLAMSGNEHAYKAYLRACTKTRKQIAYRRKMFQQIVSAESESFTVTLFLPP
jgi:hypothetical protein